jgi:hypothetical protein
MDIPLSAAVLMSLLSGPAFVAYKHPAAYRKLFRYCYPAALIVFAVLQVYDASATYMWHMIRPFIDQAKLEDAKTAADSITLVTWKWWAGGVSLSAYLIFLGMLEALGIVAPDAVKKADAVRKADAAYSRSRLDDLTSLLGSLPDDGAASRRYRVPQPPALPQSRRQAPS